MSTRDRAMRSVNRLRVLRVVMVLFLAWNLTLGVVDSAAGRYLLALVNFTCVLLLSGVMALQTYAIRRVEQREGVHGSLPVAALRRIAHRPRMTDADYRRTQELERELGWEPSDPCAPVGIPEAEFKPGGVITAGEGTAVTLTAAGAISAAALSGSASLTARARITQACDCRCCGDDVSSVQVRVPESAEPLRSYCLECALQQKRLAAAEQARKLSQAKAAVLPPAFREATIASMEPGRPYYTVPWAMQADENGTLWLRRGYTAWDRPGGTASMRIERRDDGYHVWPVPGEAYVHEALDVRRLIPVAVLEEKR